jgi:YidC/Oxa1 family membrane protein insertase
MVANAVVQGLLDGLGAVLAFLYSVIPNYGVAIILFTLAVRLVLLPLGIKQVRSMQAMQGIQPKVKQVQLRYKGNRQKVNEEVMALYKEHGVNPLSGCLPLIAQLPILFALFAVLQVPKALTHIPEDSSLYHAIVRQDTHFIGANLLCNAGQAGRNVSIANQDTEFPEELNCGNGFPVRIPYYALALAMIGTTFYQQRQMSRASPAQNPQQQMITRVMPLLFGVWGFLFPAALVLYWTTTNLVQIGQQYFLLRQQGGAKVSSEDGKPGASRGKRSELSGDGGSATRSASKKPAAGGSGSGRRGVSGRSAGSGQRTGKTRSSGDGTQRAVPPGKTSGRPGSASSSPSGQQGSGGTGGRDGGDRKKRRKR